MNTAVVTVKVDKQTKLDAQKVAKQLGFSLSAVINGYLKTLVRRKRIDFALDENEEEPTAYFLEALKESSADIKARRVIAFKSLDEEITYLDKMITDEEKGQ